MSNIFGARMQEIGAREIVEIPRRHENLRRLIIKVEKALQIVEVIGAAQRLDRGVGELDAISRCEREDHLGFERSLDMQMQFGFRESGDEIRCLHKFNSRFCLFPGQIVGKALLASVASGEFVARVGREAQEIDERQHRNGGDDQEGRREILRVQRAAAVQRARRLERRRANGDARRQRQLLGHRGEARRVAHRVLSECRRSRSH